MKNSTLKEAFLLLACISVSAVTAGCAHDPSITMDEMIVTFAQKVSTELQKNPTVIAKNPAHITIAGMQNNSRYIFEGADMDILLRRLRLELNRTSNGRIIFYSQASNVQNKRVEMLKKKRLASIKSAMERSAKEILAGKDLSHELVISCGKVSGFEKAGISSTSFIDMFRAELVKVSGNKVKFTATVTDEADYVLFGRIYTETPVDGKADNADLVLRLGLCNPETEVVDKESVVKIQNFVSDNTENADFILSGAINSISSRRKGDQVDYCLITVQITDPETNDIVWEGDSGDFVIKSQTGSVYR